MSSDFFKVDTRLLEVASFVEVDAGNLSASCFDQEFTADSAGELTRKLSRAIYGHCHTGGGAQEREVRPRLRDADLESQLAAASGRREVTVAASVVEENEEHVLVLFDGVRVTVPANRIISRSDDSVSFRLQCARPRVSPGFFYSVSSSSPPRSGTDIVRVYARIDQADDAPSVWGPIVDFLEGSGVPWHAKVLSAEALYPRNDALVLYLPRPAWGLIEGCACLLHDTGALGKGTSTFTHMINESVSCAFEPSDNRAGARERSFGEHRSHMLAEAIVSYAADPESYASLEEAIYAACVDANIDPLAVARNGSSPYVPAMRGCDR